MLKGHFSLAYFKKYCSFLLEHHLDELAEADLKRNEEIKLPLLNLFTHLSREELVALSIKGVKEYLKNIIEDKAVQVVIQSMQDWKEDKIPGIPKDQVKAADIVLIYNSRKYTLLNFLTRYTRVPEEMIQIMNEIEDFYTFQERLAMETLSDIQKEEVAMLQEELQATNEELRESNLNLEERVELRTAELKENAEQFKLVLESIPPMAWTAKPDGSVNYFSKRWYDYTGLTEAESLDTGWEQTIHPEDLPSAWETWRQRLSSGAPLEMENRFKRIDGQYRWQLVTGIPIKDTQGNVKLWVGTCTDIHDYKNITRIIRENEAQLKLITNNIPAYISYIDKEGRYMFANEYYNNLNFVTDSIKGKKLIDLQGVKSFDNLKPYFDKVLQGEQQTFETTVTLKDGSTKKLEAKLVPDYDAEGQVHGFVVMAVDLTERIEIERTLEQKNKDLIRINSDLDNFIYTASHDLKSPIANIEGLIYTLFDVLQEQNQTDEEITVLIEMLKYSIGRFQTTLNDLTEVGKAQKNFNEDVQQINVSEIVEEILHSIENQIIDSKTIIQTDIDSDIHIRFSRINFKSIIYNLLTNSIKYKSPERRPFIEISFKTSADCYTLEVRDNGLGMKKEHTGKIFGMFSRLHDHVDGSGVGLYLVKRIVENSEGTIEVESVEGVGSVFRILLPKNTFHAHA